MIKRILLAALLLLQGAAVFAQRTPGTDNTASLERRLRYLEIRVEELRSGKFDTVASVDHLGDMTFKSSVTIEGLLTYSGGLVGDLHVSSFTRVPAAAGITAATFAIAYATVTVTLPVQSTVMVSFSGDLQNATNANACVLSVTEDGAFITGQGLDNTIGMGMNTTQSNTPQNAAFTYALLDRAAGTHEYGLVIRADVSTCGLSNGDIESQFGVFTLQ